MSPAVNRLKTGIAMAFCCCRYGNGLTGQQAVMHDDVITALLDALADGCLHAQRESAYAFANLLTGTYLGSAKLTPHQVLNAT